MTLKRDDWADLARNLDWDFSYVRESDVYPEALAGSPFLPSAEWCAWSEPFRTTYADYVAGQHRKEEAVAAVRESCGSVEDLERLPIGWRNALKLHLATLPLAEFAAVIGNLRGARFGRTASWRTASTFGALDELRHTQIPLLVASEWVRSDAQFDWTHRFFHTNNWVAIAARHLVDELLLGTDAIEFAIATHFVFETGFTNLQFVGLASLAHDVGDKMFERMVTSIQSDEARHAQIGNPVLEKLIATDSKRAQCLVDKWFWRSWLFFAVVTGFAMDYLAPLEARTRSFKEFVEEWIVHQFLASLRELGLQKPFYWDTFLASLDHYHHMVYAGAYSYRATVWFDLVAPGPAERAWLREKYPASWPAIDPVWEQVADRWRAADPGNEFAVHGTTLIGFCDLCQLVLAGGTPGHNTASTLEREGRRYVFCSAPCRHFFEAEIERYAPHRGLVSRVLAGGAPANLMALLRHSFGLTRDTWGRDAHGGDYAWLDRVPK
ncbi:MAG: toluene monooxygenase [Polyangiales bacterium]